MVKSTLSSREDQERGLLASMHRTNGKKSRQCVTKGNIAFRHSKPKETNGYPGSRGPREPKKVKL